MWGTARLLEHVRWAHDPAERILESAAYEEADLIALGPGAHEDDGSGTPTWETVVGRARCSVLLMTPGMPKPDEPEFGRGWEPMVLEPAVRA